VKVESNKNQNTSKDIIKNDRRSFLKKAVYSAPSLLVLGSLARPTPSRAGESQISNGPDDGWTTQ
jgi:hypothetical protein